MMQAAGDFPVAPGQPAGRIWSRLAGVIVPAGRAQVLVVAAGLTVIVLIWAWTFAMIDRDRRQTIAEATNAAANLARVFEEHAIRTIRSADQLLRHEVRDILMPIDILVISQNDLLEHSEDPGLIFRTILREGKTVYEAG